MSDNFEFEFRQECWAKILTALHNNPPMGRNDLLHYMLVHFRWRHGVTKKYLTEAKVRNYIKTEVVGPRGKQALSVVVTA